MLQVNRKPSEQSPGNLQGVYFYGTFTKSCTSVRTLQTDKHSAVVSVQIWDTSSCGKHMGVFLQCIKNVQELIDLLTAVWTTKEFDSAHTLTEQRKQKLCMYCESRREFRHVFFSLSLSLLISQFLPFSLYLSFFLDKFTFSG